jgi:acyl-CoA thioesterase I
MTPRTAGALLVVVALAGCGRRAPQPVPASSETAIAATATAAPEIRVLVVGDSLAAGMGLPLDEAFPAVLERRLRADGLPARVQNGGVSGDTTTGGLERLGWLLRQRPDVVVIELGANDGLRGLPLDRTEENLRSLVARSRAAGASVLLVGMKVPTNMGPEYSRGFSDIFARVASDTGTPLVPFLLEGVALVPGANQADGIHPTREGQERLAANVLPHLQPLVRAAAEKGVRPLF